MRKKIYLLAVMMGMFTALSSCKKLLEIDPPKTALNAEAVFSSNETAIATVTNLYATMSNTALIQPSPTGISLFAGLSADELMLGGSGTNDFASSDNYFKNRMTPFSDISGTTDFWVSFYSTYIYPSNRIIKGLNEAVTFEEDASKSKLNAAVKRQLLGEAQFLRAFSYFYLVQLYGDVPLLTTIDFVTNSTAARTNKNLVYQQILRDLRDAEGNLSSGYVEADVTTSTAASARVRPIKWAAKALLARVHLYMGNYPAAETESKTLIVGNPLYGMQTLGEVFKMNSTEAIWQLQPVVTGRNTQDAWIFIIPAAGIRYPQNPVYLNRSLLDAFEAGDNRRTSWIGSRTLAGTTYYYPHKYKSATLNASVTEYSTVMRLSEQYLICAEALARQGRISEAQGMLNVVRHRAGLGDTPASNTETLLTAILAERRVELFTEWGHRWFDLKRTGKVDEVMRIATPLKGGQDWQPYKAYYPIMQAQWQLNRNVTQTPGYQ